MNFSNPLFIILVAHGIITLSAGIFMVKRPPKNINHLYGYRTRQSMEFKEKWDFDQKYSAQEMIRLGVILLFISTLGLFINFDELTSNMIALAIVIGTVILLLYKTEKKLKQKFESDETR